MTLHELLRRPVPPGGVRRTSDDHRLVLIEPLDLVERHQVDLEALLTQISRHHLW